MTIYGAQASRIQEEVKGTLEEAELIVQGYFNKFQGLKRWLDKQATLARYQKWVKDSLGRIYFVAESNAQGKDEENAWVRKACNGVIQGTSATMSKRAAWYTYQAYEKLNDSYSTKITGFNKAEIVAIVHDEIVSYVPGGRKLIEIKTDDKGYSKVVYECDEISWEYGKAKQEAMERAMSEILSPMIGEDFPAKAEAICGESWGIK